MLFTDGKDRYYERLMMEVPHYGNDYEPPKKKRGKEKMPYQNKHSAKKQYPDKKQTRNNSGYKHFKYRYEDLNCGYCLETMDKKTCPYPNCPHILENLDDLVCDSKFLDCVAQAENCNTPHRPTLLQLQKTLNQL